MIDRQKAIMIYRNIESYMYWQIKYKIDEIKSVIGDIQRDIMYKLYYIQIGKIRQKERNIV